MINVGRYEINILINEFSCNVSDWLEWEMDGGNKISLEIGNKFRESVLGW